MMSVEAVVVQAFNGPPSRMETTGPEKSAAIATLASKMWMNMAQTVIMTPHAWRLQEPVR